MLGNAKKGSVWGGTKVTAAGMPLVNQAESLSKTNSRSKSRRDARFAAGLSILTLVFGFALVGCGGDDDDDPGTTPGGGGGKTKVYFAFGSAPVFGNTDLGSTSGNLEFYLYKGYDDPPAFSDAQIADIKALTYADMTFSPLTTTSGGNRTLTVEIDTARGGDYDSTGWKVDADKTRVSVAVKATRSAAPSDADSTHRGTWQETELTIADKGNYTFEKQNGNIAIQW